MNGSPPPQNPQRGSPRLRWFGPRALGPSGHLKSHLFFCLVNTADVSQNDLGLLQNDQGLKPEDLGFKPSLRVESLVIRIESLVCGVG